MLLALLLSACIVVHEQSDEDSFETTDAISALVLQADAGNVTIDACDAEGATVTHALKWTGPDDARPQADAVVTGETLDVTSDCQDLNLFCEVTWTITLPASAALDVRLDAGNIAVTGIGGDANLELAAGDTDLAGLSGNVTLTSDAGNLHGTDLATPTFAATIDAGDATLGFTPAAPLVDLDVEGQSGDLSLSVPGGAWDLDVWTASGELAVFGVDDAPTAERHLTVHASAGDIDVVGG
jgi:hypothetical protein